MQNSFEGYEKPKKSRLPWYNYRVSKIFWNDIKEYHIKSINFSFQNGELTELQKQSIITFLPKKWKRQPTFRKLEAKISLLNVITK